MDRRKVVELLDRLFLIGVFVNTVVAIPWMIYKGSFSDWDRPWLGVVLERAVYILLVGVFYLFLRRRMLKEDDT